MDCYTKALICILLISRIYTLEGQRIVKKEHIPRSSSSLADEEQFQFKVQEIFHELYWTQFTDFEMKIFDILRRQEKQFKIMKRKLAANERKISDLVARVSYLEKNQEELISNRSDAPIPDFKSPEMKIQQNQNLTMIMSEQESHSLRILTLEENQKRIDQQVSVLKTNYTYIKGAINKQNYTMNEILDEQEEIHNFSTKTLSSLNQLERNYLHLDNFLNSENKSVRDIMSRRSDVETTTLIMKNNLTLLETKLSILQIALDENNKTINKVVETQNEIRSSVLTIRDNLEANSSYINIWNSNNELGNRTKSADVENNNQTSEIEMIRSASMAKVNTLEKMINNMTNAINVRVVNGSTWSEGRVEVFYNGEWGTVCDDNWNDMGAHVICRSLGYFSGVSFPGAQFGMGDGRIWMDEVDCEGSESTILDCTHDGIGTHNCDHDEDAGVVCMKSFAIRLMTGKRLSRSEGRVEILINGTWGTVCDDEWDTDDARVVCRYLGYTGSAVAKVSAAYGQGSDELPIYLDDVSCKGSESYILNCQHKGVGTHDCNHSKDAGVKCTRA